MATTCWFAANSLDFVVARSRQLAMGFFAAFDGPARAVRCACAVSRGMQSLGLEVRAGLHTGECEIMGDDMGGIAVHIGARIAARAGPGEVLVYQARSRTWSPAPA